MHQFDCLEHCLARFLAGVHAMKSHEMKCADPLRYAGDVKDYEGGLQDCVVVGAGISGLVTAQAFVAEHADTVKK